MFLFGVIFFLLFPNTVFANNEFQVSQSIQYQIDQSGDALVSQEVQLTNNFSQIYPKEYQITLSSKDIKNITGTDQSGDIIQKIDQSSEQTIIFLKFNQVNLGKNQITKFKLNYFIPSLATQKGNTWEISLPQNQNNSQNYTSQSTVFIPNNFGSLSFSSVPPQNIISLNNQTEVHIDSSNNPKILLIFGDYQLFDFEFKYFLENNTNKTNTFSITLPPETNSQQITYRSINPSPQNIVIDDDGNYLGQYQLQPKQKIEINANGQVKIIHTNSNNAEIKTKDYLKSSQYWPTDDPIIKSVSSKLKTPKEIYDYVINTLNYKYDNIDFAFRQGAVAALSNPNEALCTEFTDLFVTLARSVGIPAREVQGFAYSNNIKIKPLNINADILHAWPQYYDSTKKSWISVDPTWGKTTNGIDFFNDLDPNHFAFVFHGLDSNFPPPPGAFKNGQNIKTVKVEFAKNEVNTTQLPVKITTKKSKIIIQNPNYNSLSQLQISAQKINWHHKIDHLPPLSSTTISFPNIPINQSIFFLNKKIKVTIQSINGGTSNFDITNPYFLTNITIFVSLLITLVGLGGIIINRVKKH